MKTLIFPVFAAILISAAGCAAVSPEKNPQSSAVTLEDFKLTGDLGGDHATFTLTATARVENPKGGTIDLLDGVVALTEVGEHPKWNIRAEPNRFVLVFDRAGKFPVRLKFDAAVRQSPEGARGWSSVDFRVAPSALQPIVLRGLPAQTQFEFAGAARPERSGGDFTSYLPADGAVKLAWKEVPPEGEGKLFYSAEMLSQIGVSPGLMRQVALLEFKIMQGELKQVSLVLHGAGEVTRVQGDQVLAWNVQPLPGSADRRLVVQFNQPQNDQFTIQVQTETPLGAFPQTADALQVRPEGATRFAGWFRIVNEGAVRLEVAQAAGLSQISPDQFPETDATRAALRPAGSQRFAYRFSGPDFALRIQADQIFPELSVSQVLVYNLGENELALDAEMELEIRDAPLRELVLRVPKGYAIARLSASGLADYFLREPEGQPEAELRLVYGQPLSGRQVIQLRLERNATLGEAEWSLPRLEVAQAKTVRGHVAVAADAGYRLTPERTQGLTEIATAFFPRKVAGIQSAFRLSDPAWQAALRVERLPQTMQADAMHLFSIGEGIAYGSSLINYVISGAPVSAFKVELSDEYFNVEFTGKDLRNWQKTEGGYIVQLHTPVSGSYTLLATYERPFKAQGETLAFTGARPLDAQSEQGYAIIISAYQFERKSVDVSPGLLPLEPGEVPAEYRLFFDAPILAAYRYTSRPFSLKLAFSPLAQGDSLSQIVDRASLLTRISKQGQALTQARYFVKNRGHPNFRMALPGGQQLWSATVNGTPVVPVMDGEENLIPLPQHADPNTVMTIDLQLAAPAGDMKRVSVSAPIVNAPVMLAEWQLEPDTGQRLVYRKGSLTPVNGVPDASAFAAWGRAFTGDEAGRAVYLLIVALGLIAGALVLWRWAARESVSKFSVRHIAGTVLGLLAFALAFVPFVELGDLVAQHQIALPRDVSLLAPVQQAGSTLTVEVSNLADKASLAGFVGWCWPAALALVLWAYALVAAGRFARIGGRLAGWLALAWAALRTPHHAGAVLVIIGGFLVLNVAVPALRRLWRKPRRSASQRVEGDDTGPAPAVAAWLIAGFVCFFMSRTVIAGPMIPPPAPGLAPVAETVSQALRIEEGHDQTYALGTAKIRWHAEKGDRLPLFVAPAVLTQVSYPMQSLTLSQGAAGGNGSQELVADRGGNYDIEIRYQTPVIKRDGESGVTLPVPYGLVNRLGITLANLDVEVLSPQAVSIQRQTVGSNTVANLVLSPAHAWIGWKPRTRDVKGEKPVFYGELSQLYVPTAGVVEGAHYVIIRPAQGELSELVFDVPAGAAITDVVEPSKPAGAPASMVSLWRFDPDTRKLRVSLNPPQSRPFALLVRSQVATGPLPFEVSVGLLSVENAASQIGLLGIATGNEVQLDSVGAAAFSPINLEDFPADVGLSLQGQVPGLTVRRAFRYSDTAATAKLSASAVEPDVRVETQNTLSLGEDRTVLAASATVDITRAGIFRLSFVLPAGFDVESISGAAMSHWTESKTNEGRVITLHLNGKTEGRQEFDISLAGPGVKTATNWAVPELTLREAGKQRGTLLLVPEQGMRLQVGARDGVTQLDPQKAGIRQQGVLAFRILQTPWNLALDVEQVDPWIQVTSFQHATINEAQVKVVANLQYQIENTGLKALRVFLPTNAVSVRFQGEEMGVFVAMDGAVTNGMQEWEVKLHRRIIGPYLLQTTYQIPMPDRASETVLRGVQAAEVNLQRGFVAVQSGGRLQLRVDSASEALQPAEWQSIPRGLQKDVPAPNANFTYRMVDPAFQLPLKLERHEAAKLLPARIEHVEFTSVISDDGIMLTHAHLEMLPGDKRLLELTLPTDAHFWFAFVNRNGVWPWRNQDRILIPLEQQSRGNQSMPVEFFYSCRAGTATPRSLDLDLLAPKLDLPLEDLTWRVSLGDKWHVRKWSGSLQLQEEQQVAETTAVDLQSYLQNENSIEAERTKTAEQLLAAGNTALEQGDPQQARRSFQAAYGLSTHDAAFNEDARVQLHNMKLQEALIGLNLRQAAAAGDQALRGKVREAGGRGELSYTQQDAKDILDRNDADENSSDMRLAERIIQQQDAAATSPAAIRASVPEEGRVLTFKRAVVVEAWADLKIAIAASAVKAASWGVRVLILGTILIVLAVFAFAARPFRRNQHAA